MQEVLISVEDQRTSMITYKISAHRNQGAQFLVTLMNSLFNTVIINEFSGFTNNLFINSGSISIKNCQDLNKKPNQILYS